jgi:hypothetical protein
MFSRLGGNDNNNIRETRYAGETPAIHVGGTPALQAIVAATRRAAATHQPLLFFDEDEPAHSFILDLEPDAVFKVNARHR